MASTLTHFECKPLSLRWAVLGALFLITVLNYLDRQTLSILAPIIQADLHFSDQTYGHIVSAFLAAYTLSYLLSGPLSDWLGSRRSMILFAGWWSIAEILPVFLRSALGLGVSRMLLGLGEAGNYVAAPKAIREWFAPAERGLAIGIYTAGATVGASVAAPFISLIATRCGWSWAFVYTGLAGLLWILPWWWISRPVFAQGSVSSDTVRFRNEQTWSVKWKQVFAEADTWKLMSIRFLTDPMLYFYLFWFPKFFIGGHEVKGKAASLWCLYLFADIGAIGSGIFAKWLIQRGWRKNEAQHRILIVCACVMPASLLVPRFEGPTLSLVFAATLLAAHMAWLVMITNIIIDRFPSTLVGTATGIIASGSGLGGMLSSEVIGATVQQRGYAPVFTALAFLHLIALFVVARLRRSI